MVYSRDELVAMKFKRLGVNVRIHRTVELLNPCGIAIGSNTRIDCFCLLSAGEDGIEIGSCVHIAAGCYLFGGGGPIVLEDFSGLSSRVSLYTATDDYSRGSMTNPTVPDEYRSIRCGGVVLKKHAIVGAGCVILPGVEIGLGAAIGALACIRKNVKAFDVCAAGSRRARVVGTRGRGFLELERQYRESEEGRFFFPDQTP